MSLRLPYIAQFSLLFTFIFYLCIYFLQPRASNIERRLRFFPRHALRVTIVHYVIINPMKPKKKPLSGVLLTLPIWLEKILAGRDIIIPDPEERMRWVIELSRQNVEHVSGGPFGAAVFTGNSGKLLGAGVNRVEPLNCSPAHAEVMAIAFAQQNLRTWDLGNDAKRMVYNSRKGF
jgi:hypothetical protein